MKKKWFTENPKYFETKYDAKLNYFFFVIILICIFYTISNKYILRVGFEQYSSSSSNSIYLYTKINIIFYNVFYCLSNSLQVWVPG